MEAAKASPYAKLNNFLRKQMLTFIWLLLFFHSRLVNVSGNAIENSISQINNIFILAGQSNMAGRGGVIHNSWDGIIPPQIERNPSVFRLSWELIWEEAQEPLHKDIDWRKINGVGPGMSFANSVLNKDPSFGVIGLVPCAIGGTNISEWRRGSHLYDQMMSRTKAALSSGGTIRGVLWYQGEADTLNLEDANLYSKRLYEFLNHLRHDLQSPSLPVIQVALASGGVYTEIVRKAQLSIDLPNVRCVDAKGMELEPDALHLTTPAQLQLGQIMANVFLNTV